MNKISTYGSSGFIGGRFCELYPEETIKIPREQREPESNSIINFISTIDNHNIFTNSFIDVQTNIIIMLEILDAAKKKFNNNFTFTQISTWSVYGDTDLPAKESNHCNPKGTYGITKKCGEDLLISYCETFGITYRIFRLCNVLGESDKGVSKKKNATQYLMRELKKGNDVNLYYGGDFIRDYMYVDDTCNAIKLCLDKAEYNDIINIGSGEHHRFGDIISYIKDKVNSSSKIGVTDPSVSAFHSLVQARNMYLDNTKLTQLGFEKKYDVYRALDKIIEYENQHTNSNI